MRLAFTKKMKRIVVFASGNGSNAENLIHYFNNSSNAKVVAVFTNKKDAGVIQKAINLRIAVQYFNKIDFYDSNEVIEKVNIYQADLIVLAGFLWLVPIQFIVAFDNKIINLHPALLPKFGGKGMYGSNVHQAVLQAKEEETGITIHKVNADYDKGEIILQQSFRIEPIDDVASIEQKIHKLEFDYLPKAVEIVLEL